MLKTLFALSVLLVVSSTAFAQESSDAGSAELEVLKQSVGVWDAEAEVWPQGPDAESIKFTGVETNRAYGQHWISSDFDSEFMGEVVKVHSIVGYDLDQKKLVGTMIDHGPYSATMSGSYDAESKSIEWTTHAKAPGGEPMVQHHVVTQESPDVRILVMKAPGTDESEHSKFMQIRFVRRK